MPEAQFGARPEEIRQSAGHTLFVEGSSPMTIDPTLLKLLLDDTGVTVEPLGASYHIRSAADALCKFHPDYYFLIDRDYHDDETVEESWRKFLDADNSNLLIWRRREIENYFIVPEYLMKSAYFTGDEDRLKDVIYQSCIRRIYLDIANLVIINLREELKKSWIKCFEKTQGFDTKENALITLLNMKEFNDKEINVSRCLKKERIESEYIKVYSQFFGNEEEKLKYGFGKWLELVRGKCVISEIIGSACFNVKNRANSILQGPKKISAITEELIRKPLNEQPNDFKELHRMIVHKVK